MKVLVLVQHGKTQSTGWWVVQDFSFLVTLQSKDCSKSDFCGVVLKESSVSDSPCASWGWMLM